MSFPPEINLAAEFLRQGEIVAIPTETVYGLAANALNESAVLKIFEAKQRPSFDPLIVHIPEALSIEKYADEIPQLAWDLSEKFWPGPLTIVLPKREIIPDIVTSGHPTVGLRCPNHPLTLALLNELEFPLAAPSANPFGYISPTTARHVKDQLQDKIAYVLDGGPSYIGLESTIIGFENETPVIYRLGGIPIEDIEQITGKLHLKFNNSSNPISPGQLTSHYSPRKSLFLGNIEELKQKFKNKAVGIIRFKPAGDENWTLSAKGDLNEAAQNLFRILREADNSEYEILIAEKAPEIGIGMAINDRLQRASVRK